MYKEIDGALYRNIQIGGIGWPYEPTDEYSVPYQTDEIIVITAKFMLMGEEEVWINFLIKKDDGIWKFDTWYEMTPYPDELTAPAASSSFCVYDWETPNQIPVYTIMNFYKYQFLSDLDSDVYNDANAYSVPAQNVIDNLLLYLPDLEMDVLKKINEFDSSGVSYSKETDSFDFFITFDPAEFIIFNHNTESEQEILQILIIDKGGNAAYTSNLVVKA